MNQQKNRMTNERDFTPGPDFHIQDKEKEKLLIKLATMITDRYVQKYTHTIKPDDPEVWALDEVLTKDEVKFMLNFNHVRVPLSPEEIAKRNGLTVEKTKEICQHLCWIGCLEYSRENPNHDLWYDVPCFVPGIAEFMMMNPVLTKEHPNLATFFNLMTQMPLENITQMVPLGGDGIGMHVIPVEKAIESETQSLDIEHISHWLKKYDKLSVGQCTCRIQQKMRGEGSGEICGEFCIGLGDLAEFSVDRGMGRYITYDEAMEIVKRSEAHGFVHQTTNIDGEDKIVGLCNCAPGVCNALRTSQLYNTPNMSRSAYRAHVEKEKCVACGKCVEVCPVGAAKLGQKLCTTHGEVKYPVSQLPDGSAWGADHWNVNYREDSKINCYDTGTSPCKTACPAHLPVQGYIKMAAQGRYADALKLIKQDNPFPAVCGAICNRRCEDVCTRGTIDQPLAIDEIKKFIAYHEIEEKNRYIPVCEKDDGGMWGPDYKMAVIGAGPAGLTCAYYLRTRGYDVTVFEKNKTLGGMMVNGIPSFRMDRAVVNAEIDCLKTMGVEFKTGVDVGKDVTISQLRDEGYKAFYIAIGLQGGRNTGVPGEDAKGIESGVSFLNRMNIDNAAKLKGDTVVIGGGNVAVDVARTAVRASDGKVTMICLEGADEMPAAKDEVDEAKEEKIEVLNGWGPKEFKVKDGKVTSVVFKKCTSVKDSTGRFNPQYDENETIEIKCDNVLESIGQSAVWGDLIKGTKVEIRRNGTAVADPVTFQTAEPDIFIGGDINHGARFVIDAIADGKKGCESMHRFVHEGQSLTINRDLREFIALDTSDIVVENYDNAKRQVPGMKKGDPTKTFDDMKLPLTEEQVKKEASRCLGCGATTVDPNRCIGCGLCTTKCEFDAIHLSRDFPHASDMRTAEEKFKYLLPYVAKRGTKIIFNAAKKAVKKD